MAEKTNALFAEGLVCRLGLLADEFTRTGLLEQDSIVARHYHWKAEGVREAIRLVQQAAKEITSCRH